MATIANKPQGTISSFGLLLFVYGVLSIGAILLISGLVYVARGNNSVEMLLFFALVAIACGWFFGVLSFAPTAQPISISWDARGVVVRVGWLKRIVCEHEWAEQMSVTLFIAPEQNGRKSAYMLFIDTPSGQVKVDTRQIPWKTTSALLEALKPHMPMRSWPFHSGLYDNSTPSWRPALPATQLSEQSSTDE